VGQGGKNRARAFGQHAQQQTTAAYTAPTSEGAYQQKVHERPGLAQTQDNTNTVLANLSREEFNHPDGALVGLVLAGGAVSLLSDLGKSLARKSLVGKGGGDPADEPKAGSNPAANNDGGEPPKAGSPPASNDAPGGGSEAKPTSAETPRPLTPEEVANSKASMQARINAGDNTVATPTTTAEGAADKRLAARDTARVAMHDPVGTSLGDVDGAVARQGAAREAAQFASEAAAKDALTAAFKDAGAKIVAKTAPVQAVAEVAAETGTPAGALVATAIEGTVLVMNVNDAVTVAEIGASIVSQYGPEKATQIMASAMGSGAQTLANRATTGSNASLKKVGNTLGLKPPPQKP
jgi:hypothetical protein